MLYQALGISCSLSRYRVCSDIDPLLFGAHTLLPDLEDVKEGVEEGNDAGSVREEGCGRE
jgi:hypothetical protein